MGVTVRWLLLAGVPGIGADRQGGTLRLLPGKKHMANAESRRAHARISVFLNGGRSHQFVVDILECQSHSIAIK